MSKLIRHFALLAILLAVTVDATRSLSRVPAQKNQDPQEQHSSASDAVLTAPVLEDEILSTPKP